MTPMKITEKIRFFITAMRGASYNYEVKEEYRKLGRSILRRIAKEMGLQTGEFDIRWNPAGIATPGDHTLHTDKVYLALHDNCNSGWFYWRTVEGRKDYTGGANQIVSWTEFAAPGGFEKLVKVLKVAQAVN